MEYSRVNFDVSKPIKKNNEFNIIRNTIDYTKIGNSSKLIIKDEGKIISTNAEEINFVGQEVLAVSKDGSKVTVYTPPAAQLSEISCFNTHNVDGTNAVVEDVETVLRKLSAPNSEGNPFFLMSYSYGDEVDTYLEKEAVYETPDLFSISKSSKTYLYARAYINGIVAARNYVIPDENKIFKSQGIEIEITDYTVGLDIDAAKCKVTFDLSEIINFGGLVKLEIEHVNNELGNFTKQQEFFYDTNLLPPEITGDFVISKDTENIKYLSGVKYLDSGTLVGVNINGFSNINYLTYQNDLLKIHSDDFENYINVLPNQISGWNPKYNFSGGNYVGKFPITETGNFIEGNLSLKAIVNDIVPSEVKTSNEIENVLIDTYVSESNGLKEDFYSEAFRLTNTLETWDSTIPIIDYAGNEDSLQVKNGKLIYPKEHIISNFPLNDIDYTSCIGQKTYVRAFWDTDINHADGILKITGNITEEHLENDLIKIMISLDEINWFDLSIDYNGTLENDSGCRVERNVHNLTNGKIKFSLGHFQTDVTTGDGWGLYLKIIFADESVSSDFEISELEIWS